MRRKIRLLTPIHGSAASGQIKLRPTTEPRSPAMHRALPALTALLVLLTGACSTSGGSDGIDQSSPRSLTIGIVTAARQGRDITGYAIVDHDTNEILGSKATIPVESGFVEGKNNIISLTDCCDACRRYSAARRSGRLAKTVS